MTKLRPAKKQASRMAPTSKSSSPGSEPELLFEKLSAAFLGDPRITPSKMFGATGLMVGGKAFSMVYKGNLVIKLPKERVDALVSSGVGERFEPGTGRTMKEWLAVPPSQKSQWLKLSEEAHDFVSGAH